jgi:hypothetical protein
VKGQAQELGQQLHVAVEVVAQQQDTLQQRSQQIGQLQQEVVVTRELLLLVKVEGWRGSLLWAFGQGGMRS